MRLAPDGNAAERNSFADVLRIARFRDAIARVNSAIPADASEEEVPLIDWTLRESAREKVKVLVE